MKCQKLFSEKNQKNIIRLSSAKFVHRLVTVNLSHDTHPMVFSERMVGGRQRMKRGRLEMYRPLTYRFVDSAMT